MTRDEFWALIEDPSLKTGEDGSYSEQLENHLAGLDPAAIVSFNNHVTALMHQANRTDLYAVTVLIDDYFAGDDGWWEFRQALIGKGEGILRGGPGDPGVARRGRG